MSENSGSILFFIPFIVIALLQYILLKTKFSKTIKYGVPQAISVLFSLGFSMAIIIALTGIRVSSFKPLIFLLFFSFILSSVFIFLFNLFILVAKSLYDIENYLKNPNAELKEPNNTFLILSVILFFSTYLNIFQDIALIYLFVFIFFSLYMFTVYLALKKK